MDNVSVDLKKKSLYIEKDSYLHRLKRKISYKHPLKLIKIYSKRNCNLSALEIGVGSGYFLYLFKLAFPDSNIIGLEYDHRNIDVAKKITLNKVDIHQGNAENFSFEEKFNLITSFQVIEHLYDSNSMLENIKNHLTDDGIAIITTPNLDGNGASIMKKNWSGYREDHVNLKGFNCWVKEVEENGFDILYAGSTFFSGIPILNKLPLALLNWSLLFTFGSLKWKFGESFVCVFKLKLKN